MDIFDNLQQALEKHPDSYVSHAQMGECMICTKRQDLRAGACMDCCGKVGGKPIKNKKGETIGHRLFEKDKPENKWITGV